MAFRGTAEAFEEASHLLASFAYLVFEISSPVGRSSSWGAAVVVLVVAGCTEGG